MSNIEVSLLLILYPNPKDAKHKKIGDIPNIDSLRCVSIDNKPCPPCL